MVGAHCAAAAPFTTSHVEACQSLSAFSCSPSWVEINSEPGPSSATLFPTTAGSATYSGSAQASFGLLRAEAQQIFSGTAGTSLYTMVSAAATFSDEITVSFGPFNGTRGSIHAFYMLDGLNEQSGSLSAGSYVSVVVSSSAEGLLQTYGYGYSGGVPVGSIGAGQYAFVFGEPFSISWTLGVQDGTARIADGPPQNWGSNTPYTTDAPGYARSMFGSTLRLTGLVVYDSAMNPVPDAEFTSASGAVYTQAGITSAVPEPATCVQLLSGLGVLATAARLLRNRQRPAGQV